LVRHASRGGAAARVTRMRARATGARAHRAGTDRARVCDHPRTPAEPVPDA